VSEQPLDRLLERISDRDAKVVVVGQGYVGLPLAMRAADIGFRVLGYELASERVEALRAGKSYVEDVPDAQLASALSSGYWATDDAADLRDFDIAVITVQTPLREGVPDLSYIEAAARDLVTALRAGALVVLESTTYPGTTVDLLCPILENSSSDIRPSASTPVTSTGRLRPRRRSSRASTPHPSRRQKRSMARSSTRLSRCRQQVRPNSSNCWRTRFGT
jgi:hypothetical protein